MKFKLEVRVFAVNKAVEIMGQGTPQKDVIAKAKEIEEYVLGGVELPEVHNEAAMLNGIMENVVSSLIGLPGVQSASVADEVKDE